MAVAAARSADAKKAEDILLMDLRRMPSNPADFMLIVSANSSVHLRALEDTIEESLDQVGLTPLRREGYKSGQWCVIDYGGLLVHIFLNDVRRFYSMERLWENPRIVEWNGSKPAARAPVKKSAVPARPAKKKQPRKSSSKQKRKKK